MTAMVKQTKERERFMISPPSAITKHSSTSPVTPPSPSGVAGQEDEHEKALSAACASSSDAFDGLRRMAPLYTIIESDAEIWGSFVEDELSDELSLALNVIADYETCDNAASSPRMKKSAKSNCLLDFVDAICGGSPPSASSSSWSSAGGDSMLTSHDNDFYFDLHDGDRTLHQMTKIVIWLRGGNKRPSKLVGGEKTFHAIQIPASHKNALEPCKHAACPYLACAQKTPPPPQPVSPPQPNISMTKRGHGCFVV